MKRLATTVLFLIAAAYDGILGVIFLFAGDSLFSHYQVPPPNHWGYVQFPGALLIIFALMFLSIAIRPVKNRNLIPYGILLKVAYCSVVFYYWMTSGIPNLWKPFAICDLAFLALFIWAYITPLKKQ